MASYDQTPTMSQVISSGLNATNTMVGLTVDTVKEKARSDLLYMQAQYESDQHDFLMDLQNRSDYNNFQKYIDDFENKTMQSFNDKNSKYYCSNPYTQKKANEMLASQKVALRNKVNEVINVRTIQDVMAKDVETMKANIRNKEAQDAANANCAILANQFAHNYIDAQTYNNKVLEQAAQIKAAKLDGYYEQYVNNAIDNNLSADQFYDSIMKEHPELNDIEVRIIPTDLASPENVETGANLTSIKLSTDAQVDKTLRKNFTQNYNAQVASMQEKNYEKLSESYTQMERIKDPLQRYKYCEAALGVIDNQMKGNRLDEAKRVSYTKLFLSEMDDIDRLLKNGGSGSSNNLDKYSEVVNNDEKTFLALVENGTFNYMDAAEAYQNHLIEVWNETAGYWKETKNMTKEEAENYFQKKYGKAGIDEILNNEILNKALNRPEYAGLKKKWTNITKDIESDLKKPEKDRKYSANAMNIAGAFVIKMVAENGVGVMSPEAIEEQEQFLNNMYLDQLEKNFKGANISSDAGIIKGINILNSNDVVMKDVQGNEVWASDAAKQKVEEIAAQQQEVIAKSIDADIKDIQPHGYMKTKYDVKPIPIFEYRGDLYHLELTPDGKSYDVVDQDGNRYQSLTVKEQRYSDKQQKKANRQVIKEANTAASEHAIERGEELDKKTKSYFTPNQQKRLR